MPEQQMTGQETTDRVMTKQEMTGRAGMVRDVVVVGGGAAGLSAALTLTRARRTVTVVDAGQPRNAPATGVHGLLALDGVSLGELLARGRKEVVGYGGDILAGEVVDVEREDEVFAVVLRDGSRVRGRRLLIATGLVDELPQLPGVREQWGHGVLHCPFCHGWEVRDRRIGVLGAEPMPVHKAQLFRQWSPDVVFFAGEVELSESDRTTLEVLDVPVVTGSVARLEIEGGQVTGVRMEDGRVVEVDAVVVSTRMMARTAPFASIGITASPHPGGEFIESDDFGKTAVPGVWAAGNASDLSAQVSGAVAEGARAAQSMIADQMMADLERALAARDLAPQDVA